MKFLYYKCILVIAVLVASATAKAQESQLLITYTAGNKTLALKKGDHVRMAYPAAKLKVATRKNRKPSPIVGFRGVIDSIAPNKIWLNFGKNKTRAEFLVNEIIAIKKNSNGAILATYLVNYAVIGSSAAIATNSLDINSGATAFSAAFSAFPASIITADLFYPAKPKSKVGHNYNLKVITIY